MSIRQAWLTVIVLAYAFLALPTEAVAIGLGAGIGYAYRTGTLDQDDALLNGFVPSIDWSSQDLRIGAVLDTAVARDRLFNYRLNLNYVRSWVTLSGLPQTFDYSGGELENIFGFGVVRKPGMRWWVGPAVRLAGGSAPLDLSVPGTLVLRDAAQVEVGAGVVTGVNLHRGERLSLGLTAGYYVNWSVFEINDAVPGVLEDPQYTGPVHRFSVGMQVLFRLGDDRF